MADESQEWDNSLSEETNEQGVIEDRSAEIDGVETRPKIEKVLAKEHELTPEQTDKLISTLKSRFELPKNKKIRKLIDFADVEKTLRANPKAMFSIQKLEETGGKPQLIGIESDEFIFEDRSKESPRGRRNKTFDEADAQRKTFGPNVKFQSPKSYKKMQRSGIFDGRFDICTWSWLETDPKKREEAGYAMVGCYHDIGGSVYLTTNHPDTNGGWRASLRVKKALETKEKHKLSPEKQAELFSVLKNRFNSKPDHYKRLENVDFSDVKEALEANPALMYSIAKMEETGGSPDIIGVEADAFIFGDCSAESPDRRYLTYDQAKEMAKEFGVDMISEEAYRAMQKKIGKFDLKTWTLFATPTDIRDYGYALYGCRSDDDVLVQKRYAHIQNKDLGWRGVLRVPKV